MENHSAEAPMPARRPPSRATLRRLLAVAVLAVGSGVASYLGAGALAGRHAAEVRVAIGVGTDGGAGAVRLDAHVAALRAPALAEAALAGLLPETRAAVDDRAAAWLVPILHALDIAGGEARASVAADGATAGDPVPGLTVRESADGRTVVIRHVAADPAVAVAVPHALAETYRTELVRRRSDAAARAAADADRIARLERGLAEAEAALMRHGAGDRARQADRTRGLAEDLARAEVVARAGALRAAAAREARGTARAETLPDVQRAPAVQALRQRRTALARRIAEIATPPPASAGPRLRQLRAEAADVERRLTAEIGHIVDALVLEAQQAADREAGLRQRLADVGRTTLAAPVDDGTHAALRADLDARRAELDRARQAAAVARRDAAPASDPATTVTIVSASPVTPHPLPGRGALSGVIALATLLVGVSLTSRRGARAPPPADLAAPRPPTPATVAPPVRRLTTADDVVAHLAFRTPRHGGYRSLVVAEPGADAHALALAVADGLARLGEPTIIVEWGHGPGSFVRRLGLAPQPGTAELASGTAGFEAVVAGLPGSSCHLIPAGLGADPVPLDGEYVGLVLDALDAAYAHIVVTGEPALLAAVFEGTDGRFDTGITVAAATGDYATDGADNAADGLFLGFEVEGIDLVRLAPPSAPGPARRRQRHPWFTGTA
jgi:uncharacterized protein involved in exopolysaccharide biosynthesis